MSLSHLKIEKNAIEGAGSFLSLKESVLRLATIAGAVVEVNWCTVPDKHYMILLGGLQQKVRLKRNHRIHLWRICTLDPNARVQSVRSCPGLVPVTLDPPVG